MVVGSFRGALQDDHVAFNIAALQERPQVRALPPLPPARKRYTTLPVDVKAIFSLLDGRWTLLILLRQR